MGHAGDVLAQPRALSGLLRGLLFHGFQHFRRQRDLAKCRPQHLWVRSQSGRRKVCGRGRSRESLDLPDLVPRAVGRAEGVAEMGPHRVHYRLAGGGHAFPPRLRRGVLAEDVDRPRHRSDRLWPPAQAGGALRRVGELPRTHRVARVRRRRWSDVRLCAQHGWRRPVRFHAPDAFAGDDQGPQYRTHGADAHRGGRRAEALHEVLRLRPQQAQGARRRREAGRPRPQGHRRGRRADLRGAQRRCRPSVARGAASGGAPGGAGGG
mmetsp:Transcript_15805/g.41875  ORF Transcript_15805/g.41875 Transcript_15805/m.41875 type:complete len:265 (-) Transcript_15805:439-1233(-)